MDIDDLSQLERIIMNELVSLTDDIVDETRKIEKEEINKVVYGWGTPRVYKRRKEKGGLIADENIDTLAPMIGSDSIELVITNRTQTAKGDGDLDGIIEDGWGDRRYAWSKPRPFTKSTQDRINKSGEIENVIKRKSKFDIE